VRVKLDAGLVSEADEESEQVIQSLLMSAFPQYGFLGEETGEKSGTGGRWICDPLDGTTNYVYGYPFFCISIGLEVAGELVVGVVEAPLLGDIFGAVKGGGAFRNGHRIHVSTRKTLSESLLATGFYYLTEADLNKQIQMFHRMIQQTNGVRRAGSAALDLCHVACGIFDGFWEKGLKPWDTAAGTLMVREAGGIVTDYKNRPYSVALDSILAGSNLVHPQLVESFATNFR
jgi:myo-inositol-1(or 4)-monophosphatase